MTDSHETGVHPDDLPDADDHGMWSRDELWRANNPGASAARGVLVALALSTLIYAAGLGLILLMER